MRKSVSQLASTWVCLAVLASGALADEVRVANEPVLIARPDAFKTLVNPPCSYCVTEAKRRAGELKPNEPVLAWTRRNHEG
ncbi:MAG: hypothetical protein IH991_15110, partial [Planctomycetes bacterium]|nr:hypothetical protein [Planctomycetota bacterium]